MTFLPNGFLSQGGISFWIWYLEGTLKSMAADDHTIFVSLPTLEATLSIAISGLWRFFGQTLCGVKVGLKYT